MVLTGQAKTDYQREYMRRRRATRSNASVTIKQESVRPKQPVSVRPKRPSGISDSQWNYIKMKAEQDGQA